MRILRLKNIFFLLSFMILSGCSMIDGFFNYKVDLETLNILVDKDANNNSAIALDLLIVCDPEADKEFAKLTAQQYFHQKSDLVTVHAQKVLVWHWEVVPGQIMKKLKITFNEFEPIAGYLYAWYDNGKLNRIKIPQGKEMTVQLSKNKYQISVTAEKNEE